MSDLALSGEVAFRVDFAGPVPPVETLYWRGQVLDSFDGRVWSRKRPFRLNISNGNFRFAPILFLAENLKIIDKMKSESFDEIVDKYVELNVAHPFREGNGRSMRIWLDALLKHRLGR